MTDEDGTSGFKAGEIAAKALDLPISTSHSPQTTDNIPATHLNAKAANFGAHEDFRTGQGADDEMQIDQKIAITDFFYDDKTLGLTNSNEEVERRELAEEVIAFMWQLCLDDSVFGG